MIIALSTGIPAIIGAITALIVALKSNGKVNNHMDTLHSPPESTTKGPTV